MEQLSASLLLTVGILLLIAGVIFAILQVWPYTDLLWAGAFGFHISTFLSYIGGFMNENDRTILEQAIYEEMELTPEMIRSIRTLCGVCLCSFVESKAFKIAIVPSADRSMDTCTVCQTRRGHDYVVMNR